MRNKIVLLASVLTLLVLAPPAYGQDGGEVEPKQTTFRLTILGEPPSDEAFILSFAPGPGDVGAEAIFCGDPQVASELAEFLEGEDQPSYQRCEGGRTYTVTATAYGTVGYAFQRVWRSADDVRQVETVAEDNVAPAGNTYSATYTYPGAGGDQQEGEDLPKEVPNTGTGSTDQWSTQRIGSAIAAVAIVSAVALRRRTNRRDAASRQER